MTIELLTSLLAWCALINIALLFVWLCFFIFAHDCVYKIHKKWFVLSLDKFDSIHYGLIGAYKLTILVFFLIPYLVLRNIY